VMPQILLRIRLTINPRENTLQTRVASSINEVKVSSEDSHFLVI